jgi:hypothetical protein
MPTRKSKVGGRRPGAGRPKGSGGPPELLRCHRVVVLLTEDELVGLQRWAEERDLPVGRLASDVVRRALRRR